MHHVQWIVMVTMVGAAGAEHDIAERDEHAHIVATCLGWRTEAKPQRECGAGKQGKGSHRKFLQGFHRGIGVVSRFGQSR